MIMKKYIIIAFALLSLLFVSCGTTNSQSETNRTEDENITKGHSSSPENESSPNVRPLYYNSVYELELSLNEENEENIYVQYSETEITRDQLNVLENFVEKYRSQKNTTPCLNGKTVEFRNKEGFYNISLFPSERFGLPWIFYHPYVSTGENFYIKTTYLPDNIVQKQKNLIASEVIKELSPNSPNINNLGVQHKNIYNSKIKLRDCEVTALVIEYKTDSRNSFIFVYNDLLVEVRCDPNVWNAQWFSSLSFGDYE